MKRILIVLSLLMLVACSPKERPIPAAFELEQTSVPGINTGQDEDNTSAANVFPVIYDDDGSPDGTTALLYLLSQPNVNLIAINVSFGEAYPEIYIQHLGRMMDDFGINPIALGYGKEPASTNNLQFPEAIRTSSGKFWGFPIPNSKKNYPSQPAPELIVSAIKQSPLPVTLFVTGPCTDLAEALRIDPEIRNNIADVFIMGGAVYVSGNIHDFYPDHKNTVAEWNFVADPQAAKEVFESGLDIYLVPLDATNQVLVSSRDTKQWRQGGEIADFAADIYDWMLNNFGTGEVAIWDLMTAAIMLEPNLCDFTPLHLEVITKNERTLGQTAILSEGQANVSVCLKPKADLIRQSVIDVFLNQR